jgi:hypothetical protein
LGEPWCEEVMRQVRGWVGGLLMASFFVACGGGSTAGNGKSGTGGASGIGGPSRPGGTSGMSGSSGSGENACGQPCACASGVDGTWDCAENECACPTCSAFEPPDPPPFEACGGDPTGFWRLAPGRNDGQSFTVLLDAPSGDRVTCPGQLVEPAPPTQYFLALEPNGRAEGIAQMPDKDFQVSESCLAQVPANCNSLSNVYDCKRTDCGLCDCTLAGSSGSLEDASWSVEGAQLTIEGRGSFGRFSFCVKGDTLTYSADGGEPLVLERVYRTGEPRLCAERSPADCAKGDNQTCQLGECVGTGSCTEAAPGEAACSKFQDCTWKPDTCHGTVSTACTLSDLVEGAPGCAFAETQPSCVGTPWKCEDQPNCAAKGCLIGPSCLGGEQTCEWDDEGVEGCECDESEFELECSGTFDCSTIKNAATCEDSGVDQGLLEACRWSKTACVATATPCKDLSLTECETTIGCHLEAQ